MKSTIKATRTLAAAVLVLASGCGAPARAQAVPPANAEDVDYAALDDLPDWRGIWLPTGGPGPFAEAPVLKTEYQDRRRADLDGDASGAPAGIPVRTSNCLPPGMPRIMTQPYSLEFLFTPGKVTIIQEAYMQVRRVFTDGRVLADDLDPSFNGYSTGHWEGDTLVVETVGIKDSVPLVRSGIWHGPELKIRERIFLDENDSDLLHLELTLEDRDALAEPWHGQATFRRSREWEQIEFVCAENDRNPVGPDGETNFILAE